MLKRFLFVCAALLVAAPLAGRALAVPLDTPTAAIVDVTDSKYVLEITAGPSGAPNGFGVYWMTQQDYDDYGGVWPSLIYPTLDWALFNGAPTLNTFEQFTTFALAPNQTIRVEIGDLEDETGVNTNTPEEIDPEIPYVTCTYALGGAGFTQSGFSTATPFKSSPHEQCRFSKGYWRNHPSAWPVASLQLGTVTYTKAQLLQILGQPSNGNGLVSLAKQLIATKLNLLLGSDPTPVAATVAAADAQIGSRVVPPVGSGYLAPNTTSAKTQYLDDYNNGKYGSHHCTPPTPAKPTTWGRLKTLYR